MVNSRVKWFFGRKIIRQVVAVMADESKDQKASIISGKIYL